MKPPSSFPAPIVGRRSSGDVRNVGSLSGLILVQDVVLRVFDLARVRILYRLLPHDADVGVDVMEKGIRELAVERGFKVLDTMIEEVAFGIKALKVLLSLEEMGGILEQMEKEIAGVENVGSMETVSITRF